MTDGAEAFRMERIGRLLYELRYEVEKGVMLNEIDETMAFRFVIPVSRSIPDGHVLCEFQTRPLPKSMMSPDDVQPKLKLVNGD